MLLKEICKRSAEGTQTTAEKCVVKNQQQTMAVSATTECICCLHRITITTCEGIRLLTPFLIPSITDLNLEAQNLWRKYKKERDERVWAASY